MKKLFLLPLFLFCLNISAQSVSLLEFEDAEIERIILNENKKNDSLTKSKSTTKTTVNNKLIKRADGFFDKLWYAEAAKVYDEALNGKQKDFPAAVWLRAGDSHYFNSNMKMASKYYQIAYKKDADSVSNDDLFKYAHALKGTGRYKKANRIMKVFNAQDKQTLLANNEANTIENSLAENSKPYEVEIKNLNINSEYSDFSPMIIGAGKFLYASSKDSAFLKTRRYKWNKQPYLDLYVGEVGDDLEKVKNVEKLPQTINSKYHEAAVTFSPDKNTIYFTRNNYGKKLKRDQNGVNHLKIYTSTKTENGWSEAKELPFNSENYSTGHPAMNQDGTKLYFVSDMPGGYGATDVYYVNIKEDGSYSAPINLGEGVNSRRKEMFPFVSENALYFSSNRSEGFGGLDIYKADIVDEEYTNITNIGEPINSNKDDFSFVMDEVNNSGYFASNRDGGKGDDDIYAFTNLEIKPPVDKNAIIEGVVLDELTGNPIQEALVALLDEDQNKLAEIATDEKGRFQFDDVRKQSNYTIVSNLLSYNEDSKSIATEDKARISLELLMKKEAAPIVMEDGVKKLKIDNINFDFDRYYIKSDAASELDRLLAVWEEYPEMVIKIESHTDSRGSRAYNQYLSDKRAKATRDYLIKNGIDPSRIASAEGFGEDRPLNNCEDGIPCSRDNHLENRRSEFIIVSM